MIIGSVDVDVRGVPVFFTAWEVNPCHPIALQSPVLTHAVRPTVSQANCIPPAVNLFHLFIFFFPPNLCTLLALDTGHLRSPVIHEDAQRYLKL